MGAAPGATNKGLMAATSPEKHHVVCVFRRPIFYSDTLVSLRAGPLVHVEIMPIEVDNPHNSISYTSYIGCPFSMSISMKRTYDNTSCVAVALEVSQEEKERLTSYLHDLCEANIPYNYVDTAMMVLPTSVHGCLSDDVSSEDPVHLTALFCSQAVVLALRNGLNEQRDLYEVLAAVNSRVVLPYTLFHLLRPYGRTVCCHALRTGTLVPLPLGANI